MDMMAMAVLFDMASRNRRSDEEFERRSRGRTETLAENLLAALFRTSRPAERRDDCGGIPCMAP
ncbi:hypothetical protein [Sinorhizobium americanum]|uniref:Uncharacterized protein n=1 Tax=Sinorhizobium americanum TaxID=194963 RepID=A0A1L3LIX0_9HYPH|nr:hypothetical protein [Sinorhizobium americanum]APG83505.1 hypothetical protein SAMCCGM7_Ch0719 [Sinorhizobium americanum CCGM7]APG90040.1 hypothetical protein SAMCFNEI73_Ch0715 [Sinorhizobium americanum]OAP42369.1 hypothetical protein ATC00_27540 [Sinorhizobium americanum]TCN36495.1 hypothetical protein EV184_101487 [Sinorhizobium americanum]